MGVLGSYVRPHTEGEQFAMAGAESQTGEYAAQRAEQRLVGDAYGISNPSFDPSQRQQIPYKAPHTNLRLERGGRKGSRVFRNR